MNEIMQNIYLKELEHDGIPVIRMSADIPYMQGGGRKVRRFNSFYAHITHAVEKHIVKKLLPQAKTDFLAALEQSRTFEPYRIKIESEIVQPTDSEALTVRRRLYARLRGGHEREKIFTENWDTRLGLPDGLYAENYD